MGNTFVRVDVSMEISPRHWISPWEKRSHKKPLPVGNSHLPVGKMGNLAAPILGRLERICYGQRLTYVHYKLNYSFLPQTKELRETNTMLDKWLRKV